VVVLGTDPGPDGLRRLLLRLAREVGVRHVAQGDGPYGWVIVNVGGIPKRIALESGGVDLLFRGARPPPIRSWLPMTSL
jgi:hypothetical protein